MARYASGKHARGACDRCGFVYKLNDLKELIVNEARTNLLVCQSCWEPDHPQYRVNRIRVEDAQALRNPRPQNPPEEPPAES